MSGENLEMQKCPRCGSPAAQMVSVEAGMRLALEKLPNVGQLPAQVCSTCYSQLTGAVSQGVKLRLEQLAREKNRHMLWKSRVNLVKHARQMMIQKAYSEAAISYEKYIRVLEISYELKAGELNPNVFGKSSRSKELTVIATTYWDLMRIYDTGPQYRDRMAVAARKLAEFIPFSPLFPDMAKKAQAFASSAKNPDIVREFLRLSKVGGGRCFIATAAFDYPEHPVVSALRVFRDERLKNHKYGRRFVALYYRHSRPIARYIQNHSWSKKPVRALVQVAHFFTKI